MTVRLSKSNTDRIASKDRGVAGSKPDGTSASGGASPAGTPAGTAASLPTYTDAGNPQININKPASAGATYSVTYSIAGGASLVATLFPFTINPGSDVTTFSLYAEESGFTRSPTDLQSWNSLFL